MAKHSAHLHAPLVPRTRATKTHVPAYAALAAVMLAVAGLLLPAAAWAQAASCRLEQHGGTGTFDVGPAGGGVTASAILSNMTYDAATSGTVTFVDDSGRAYPTPPAATRWLLTNSNTLTRLLITFSVPIPAHRLGFAIEDLGTGTLATLPPYDPRITVATTGGAAPSDFVGHALGTATRALYDTATGQVSMAGRDPTAPATLRQSIFLRGNSTALVSTVSLTATGVLNGDFVAIRMVSIPSCVRIAKGTTGGTGSFGFTTAGLSTWPVTTPGTVTVATTAIGTAQASPRFYYQAGIPGSGVGTSPVTLSEAVPPGWRLTGASCTDANAARNGNTGSFGTLAGGVLTIPGDRMRFESDITCTFANAREVDLSIVKSALPSSVQSGGLVTFTLTASNLTAGSLVEDAILRDTVPAGLDCTEAGLSPPTCSASGDAQCPASAVTAAALTSPAGVAIPRLAGGASVAVTLQCRVTASGE